MPKHFVLEEYDDIMDTEVVSMPPSAVVLPPKPGRGLAIKGTTIVAEAEEILGLREAEGISDQQKLLLVAYAATGTVTAACRAVGVSQQTHRKWLKENEAYRDMFDTAFDAVTDRLEETSLVASLEPENMKERMFQLQARRPDRYGQRLNAKVSGKVEHVHSMAELAKQAYAEGALGGDDDE